MKKILLTIFSMAICFNFVGKACAFVRYEEKNPKRQQELKVSGFVDYAPFGWEQKYDGKNIAGYYTVFEPLLKLFEEDANVIMNKSFAMGNVDDLVQKVREGNIDFFVGVYNETELFRGLHVLFPAVIYNPITIFMLPNRISEVKTTEDLKKLKGVVNTKELFSDFVDRKIAEYNPIEVDSMFKAFEKIYTREADYIISSYYNGMIEATKLGLENQIAPAKQALWRIPMFVGVSKTSRHRDMISKRITKYLTDKNTIKAVEENLQKIIYQFQDRYKGVVAPSFVNYNNQSDNAALPEKE